MTKIIDGKAIANKILEKTKKEIQKQSLKPKLAVVVVGKDKPSRTYVKRKQEAAEKIGIEFEMHKYDENIKQEKIIAEIKKIQKDKKLTGLIVQLPLPEHLYTSGVLNAINPEIDVDCLTDTNFGKLIMKTNFIEPPTPGAVMDILEDLNIDVKGKNITIVGAGALVGKPLSIILLNKEATVTTCNIHTKNLKKKCKQADIIITAVGKKDLIKANMVKKGTIVIDTGIAFADHKMYGDVDFLKVAKKASYITPTPGGVGPITVAKLLWNTVVCAKKKYE